MKSLKSNAQVCLAFYCVALVTIPLFVIRCAADDSALPCPSPCKCHKGRRYESYGEVNRIDCSNLGLTSVPDLKPLEGSTISNYLQLDQNEIQNISKADFPPGMKIVILDLSSNKGIKISTDALLNLGYSLRKLTVEAVDIVFDKTLDIFDGLFSLDYLSLENNNKHPYTKGAVQDVTATLFQGEIAKSLKSLQLAFCGIRTMGDETLKSLTNLEELNLSNNWLTVVPSTIRHLPNLRFVEFFYCKIKALQDNAFSDLPKLKEIDLSSNPQLTTISDHAFSGCENSLKYLKLQRCGLTQIPTKALHDLKKLTTLDISENNFVDVGSQPLSGEYKLSHLVISSKGLKFNKDIFLGQEENIVDLSIPRMDLETIPVEALRILTQLKRLSLEYNNITELPEDAFTGLNVTSIRLDNNPLSRIEKGAFNGLPLNLIISLRRTKVEDMEFLSDYREDAIDTVNLEHSNLQCLCSMKESLNVTKSIKHVSGSCTIGDETYHITSSKLGGVLDKACEEEKRNNSGNTLMTCINTLVVSLVVMLVSVFDY